MFRMPLTADRQPGRTPRSAGSTNSPFVHISWTSTRSGGQGYLVEEDELVHDTTGCLSCLPSRPVLARKIRSPMHNRIAGAGISVTAGEGESATQGLRR